MGFFMNYLVSLFLDNWRCEEAPEAWMKPEKYEIMKDDLNILWFFLQIAFPVCDKGTGMRSTFVEAQQ